MSLAVGPVGPFLLAPLLRELGPQAVLLVGPPAEAAAVERLLEASPRPPAGLARFDSLPSLERVGTPDCVVWSGDPNWHTAFHDLSALAARARADGVPFPLVFVDHVGWPYGRRDGYDRPETIPLESRNASRRFGLRPSSALPVAVGGLHAHRHNGLFMWGSRNGVLTAVEDFLAAEGDGASRVSFAKVPGYHPLGVLVGPARVAPGGRLARLLEDPIAALTGAGIARALALAEVEARRPTLDTLQRAILAPPAEPEGLEDLPTPEPSGNVLRDMLRWTLLAHRFHAQLLRVIDEVLSRAGVPYSVAEGTLLGALRHGGPIPHDDDVDIAVPEGEMDRMRGALEGAGLTAVEGKGWPQLGRTFVIGVRQPHVEHCGYWPRRPAVDVFPSSEGPDAVMHPDEMLPLTRHPYCDFTVAVPAQARKVLERRFGPGWETECVVWQHGSLPGIGRDGGTLPLALYEEICAEEGYVPPTTLPVADLPPPGTS